MYFDGREAKISDRTHTGYRDIYRVHIKPTFGNRPGSSILPSDVESWVSALLVGDRSEKTVKQALGVLRRIMRKAAFDKAIASNPTTEVRVSTWLKRRDTFQHRPLSAGQIAAVSDHIASVKRNPIFALAVTFAAFTGVRAAELAGLEIADLTLSDVPGTVGAIRVHRTKTRRKLKGQDAQWKVGTPKSEKSTRTVPLDAWLADDMREYLSREHQNANDPTAPLFPGRLNRHRASELSRNFADPVDMLDWSTPLVPDFVYETNFKPALESLGFRAARWHDLRHSYAVMSLSAGEHYMQVSKWLGHATFTLTLDTYGDYIASVEGGKAAPLARPVGVTAQTNNVVPFNRQAN